MTVAQGLRQRETQWRRTGAGRVEGKSPEQSCLFCNMEGKNAAWASAEGRTGTGSAQDKLCCRGMVGGLYCLQPVVLRHCLDSMAQKRFPHLFSIWTHTLVGGSRGQLAEGFTALWDLQVSLPQGN